tara:strand:- start:1910 stop:2836 length:927 start_codon:yes stop_codon:yes gene_type:complete
LNRKFFKLYIIVPIPNAIIREEFKIEISLATSANHIIYGPKKITSAILAACPLPIFILLYIIIIKMVKEILYRVINCAIHKKRLETFEKLAEKAGLGKVPRVACVNGKKYTETKLCKMIEDKIISPKANLTPIEIAICLSHEKCWKQLIKSKHAKYMVVFEDDCRLKKNFSEKLDELMNADLGFDILYLFNGNWMRSLSRRKKVAKVGDLKVYRETVEYNPSGSCYVISKAWARELSKKMKPIKIPVDIFMGSVRVKSAKHYTLNNTRAKNDPPECWTISPLMNVFCGGGDESTQDYEAKKIKKIKCK